MPSTLTELLIILFAILPGFPAYLVYKSYFGTDWRATDWEKVIGIISFSVGGLIVYILISSIIILPKPLYLLPTTFDPKSFGTGSLLPIALSYFGHSISSIIIAFLIVICIRIVSKWCSSSPYPAAWDEFIRADVPDHWIVIRLNNDETYAGMINYGDTSVSLAERDIVLIEPAKFDETSKLYKMLPYQKLFLPAGLIASIAIVYNPDKDERITKIGSTLFAKEE
jgi:hypothetical protein